MSNGIMDKKEGTRVEGQQHWGRFETSQYSQAHPFSPALAAALSDTAGLPLHLCFLCTAGKIPPPEPRPALCLDVDFGLSFISSNVKSYLEAEARNIQVPAVASPRTHLDSRGPLHCGA